MNKGSFHGYYLYGSRILLLSMLSVVFSGVCVGRSSDLRVFSNRRPFQILRTMDDVLLSNQRPFQSKDLCVILPCLMMNVGQVCTSSALHITSNECKTYKSRAPDPRFISDPLS